MAHQPIHANHEKEGIVKRIDLTLTDALEHRLEEPAFIESDADLPMALMQAIGEFLDAYNGELVLPLHINAAPAGPAAALPLVTTDLGGRGDS